MHAVQSGNIYYNCPRSSCTPVSRSREMFIIIVHSSCTPLSRSQEVFIIILLSPKHNKLVSSPSSLGSRSVPWLGEVSLSCDVLCQIVSLQYLSRSSLRRLAGLPCRPFLSYGIQVVTREVHRSSLRRLICPAQDHLIFLTMLIISMTFVLSLTLMLVFLCLHVTLSILQIIQNQS